MIQHMARSNRPTKYELGRIAEKQPELLNVLVAYFVLEWRSVILGKPPHGKDQTGKVCLVPNYVRAWGVNACVHYLLRAPEERKPEGTGFLSIWLEKIS